MLTGKVYHVSTWRPRPYDLQPPENRGLLLEAVAVCMVGNQWIAMCSLGGVQVRGRTADTPVRAMQSLLWEFTGASGNDNAKLGLELAMNGHDIGDQLQRLRSAGDLPPALAAAVPEHPDAEAARVAEGYRAHALDRGQAGDRSGG